MHYKNQQIPKISRKKEIEILNSLGLEAYEINYLINQRLKRINEKKWK